MPFDMPPEAVEVLSDPLWRMRVRPHVNEDGSEVWAELYWITDKKGQRVLFEPNEAQKDFLREAHGHDIILKARQLGFTTLICIAYLDRCLFTANIRAAIIAHKVDDATVFFRDKVKFAYDNLPEDIKAELPLTTDSKSELMLANNSSLRVSTSARSGTLQLLHVSEFGKICATNGAKAEEIVTGAFEAVGEGGRITIESTAEGQEGDFYRMSQEAQVLAASDTPLSAEDFKFHFYPWHGNPLYVANPETARITEADIKYFDKLEHEHGIVLSDGQKAWYVAKERTLGGNMKREHPSTPEEAFEQAIEGAYFAHQFASADKHGRIGEFPIVPGVPVNSFWDLGHNDQTAIWLHQAVGGRNRFVGYYENNGEALPHYVNWLREWERDHDAVHGEEYWPHDGGARHDLFYKDNKTRIEIAWEAGLRPIVVPRTASKLDSIEAARMVFASCDFDARGCTCAPNEKKIDGIARLRAYRKEYDTKNEVYRDRPHHGPESNGADAFQTFATGYRPPTKDTRRRVGAVTRQM